MNIPIGRDYLFTIEVLQPDSFTPLDITGYSGTMNVYLQEDDSHIAACTLIPVSGSEAEGLMKGTILGTDTSGVIVEKGDPADQYYAKARHAGFINIYKAGASDINVTIPKIAFVPSGA